MCLRPCSSDETRTINKLDDIAKPEFRRISIADPSHAPYGFAAREALQKAGLWDSVSEKIVIAENVKQALTYAQTNDVDATITAASLCPKTGRRIVIQENLYTPLQQTIAITAKCTHPAEARQFELFLTGKVGQRILSEGGFGRPFHGRIS